MNNEELLTPMEKRWGSEIQNQPPDGCPEAEQILELAERGKRSPHYDTMMSHVVRCASCLETYKQLKQAETLAQQARTAGAWYRQPLFRWSLAPVVAAALVGLYFALQSLFPGTVQTVEKPRQEQPSVVKDPQNPAPKPETPQLADKPKPSPPKMPEREPKPSPRPEPSRTEYASNLWLERGALYEGGQRLPDWSSNYVKRLRDEPPAYRSNGETDRPALEMMEPDIQNAAMEETRPVFRWIPVEGASGYEATLEQRGLSGRYQGMANLLSVEDSSARLQEGESLQRGESYRLQVRVLTEDPLDPLANAPPLTYSFRVLTAREVQQLSWARNSVRKTPVASAMTLFALGFIPEALKAMPVDSKDPRIQTWRKAMEERLHRRD
ncbi:MAG: hypothetical protein KIT45_03525 [Fimbriimonadia bacterium]|nr:hypothetical protein [Fimbriimonadia bacterium]